MRSEFRDMFNILAVIIAVFMLFSFASGYIVAQSVCNNGSYLSMKQKQNLSERKATVLEIDGVKYIIRKLSEKK